MTVIAGPLLAGVALPAARYWAGSSRRDSSLAAVPLAAAALAALALLALLPWAGSGAVLSIKWLPGAGPMGIGLGTTGLYVALATTGACALAQWGEWSLSGARARESGWMGALTLLSIAAAQVAFLAEHFLARYVALEIVALCVALAPLVELRPPLVRPTLGASPAGGHIENGHTGGTLARLVYLVLRLGDVGLLAAILVLWSAGGTLDIAPALEAGLALDAARLHWAVAGFVLAVWVKVGGWPAHLWQQTGGRLSLFSHSWLYATLMPNLGLYLLYRVTPLLVKAGAVQSAAYGVGAVGAVLAAVLALATTRSGIRASLVYLGAALGGLALVLAASGLKTVVWMTALVLTPLRLLFTLAGDTGSAGHAATGRIAPAHVLSVGLYALGGLALTGYCLLCTWWARQVGAPLAAVLAAEFAGVTIGIWALRSAWLLWRSPGQPGTAAQSVPSSRRLDPSGPPPPDGRRSMSASAWVGRRPVSGTLAVAVLGSIVLAGVLFWGPLSGHLIRAARGTSLTLPTALDMVRYLASTPAFWGAIVLAAAGWSLFLVRPRASLQALGSAALGFQEPGKQALNLEQGLAQAAHILSTVVEVGIQERILGGIVRAVLGGARTTRRVVEQGILDGGIRWVSESVIAGGRLSYRVLEQEGLEGLLRGAVRGALAGGRWMQRWHTGRLRRNLLWVAVSLFLAIVALALYGW